MGSRVKIRRIIWRMWKRTIFAVILIIVCFQFAYLFRNSNANVACTFPNVDPFNEEVMDYLRENKFEVNCDKVELLFNSTVDGRIVPVNKEEFGRLGIERCCYKVFWRVGEDDLSIKMGENCHPVSLDGETRIKEEFEFIAVWCEDEGGNGSFVDYHAFIPVRKELEERLDRIGGKERVNVVVLGIDSVSRMNFMRTMIKSREYLEELGAVEMKGYNKIGDSTYPNIFPLLASLSETEVDWGCGWSKAFDTCPMIWKKFEEKGYRTSYSEEGDRLDGTAFNYVHNGFKQQPTHYYLRPLSIAFWRSELGSKKFCFGPRLSFQHVSDHMKKFMFKMNGIGKPYFEFAWTALAHDHLGAGFYVDEVVLDLLKWTKDRGYLNNTVFILMSDHGIRFSSFRETIQGQIEDRLPFVNILMPDWIKTKYPSAYQNLLGNRERLMTTYDLYEVFVDLLNLDLEDEIIKRRSEELMNSLNIPRGISLFLPIPQGRTCLMAQIDPNYCSCNAMREIPVGSATAMKAASVAVGKINSIVEPHKGCKILNLSRVLIAQSVQETVGDWRGVKINFEAKPSNATFEALVKVGSNEEEWKVVGAISRTNLYGNTSRCVDNSFVRLYCYCD